MAMCKGEKRTHALARIVSFAVLAGTVGCASVPAPAERHIIVATYTYASEADCHADANRTGTDLASTVYGSRVLTGCRNEGNGVWSREALVDER